MTAEQIITALEAVIEQYYAELVPPVEQPLVVPVGGDLQAALDQGGPIQLEAGEYVGGFTLPTGTDLRGVDGTVIRATNARPALYVAPGSSNIRVRDLDCYSNYSAVVCLGDNFVETQNSLEQVPFDIVLTNVGVPSHRGRRGFEINSRDTFLIGCWTTDIYDPNLNDSQGVFIMNTPGPVTIDGGVYEAGSENIMVGGSGMKIPDCRPSNITIRNLSLTRPQSWRTDGINRAVKTSLEFKTGDNCLVENIYIDGCWKAAQDGYGITVTPRNAGACTNITFRDVVMRNVSSGFNIMGVDSATVTPIPTTGIVIEDCDIQASMVQAGGGRGIFAQITNGPGTINVQRVNVTTDGTSFVLHSGAAIGSLTVQDSIYRAGSYGFMIAGGANGSNWEAGCGALVVTGNTVSGANSVFRSEFPDNTFV